MRTATMTWLLAGTIAAQDPGADLAGTMEKLADATTALQRAIEAADRDGIPSPLAEIERQVRTLRTLTLPGANVDGAAALDTIGAAIADLRNPVGDGKASDPWDLARLRAACTSCHLAVRTENAERGLFPNRGNVVHGTLRLEEQGGAPRDDASGVVVFLEAPGLQATPLPRVPVISQRGRRFQPAVLAVTTGTTVHFPNDDTVFHNVFSLSRGNTFDLGSYGKGLAKDQVLAHPGLVKVHCNIHPDMAAHVLVLETPFRAVTSTSGFWAIADVPDGDYTLRVWQPLAVEQRHAISVAGGGSKAIELTVRETKPRVQHANKNGRPYPAKY